MSLYLVFPSISLSISLSLRNPTGKLVDVVCDGRLKATHNNRDHMVFLEERHVYIASPHHLGPVTAEVDVRPAERGEFERDLSSERNAPVSVSETQDTNSAETLVLSLYF